MKVLSLILSIFLFQSIYSSAKEDKVTNFPYYSYDGPLYSGYLNVSEKKSSITYLMKQKMTQKIKNL